MVMAFYPAIRIIRPAFSHVKQHLVDSRSRKDIQVTAVHHAAQVLFGIKEFHKRRGRRVCFIQPALTSSQTDRQADEDIYFPYFNLSHFC
jgi:hypothetical protein